MLLLRKRGGKAEGGKKKSIKRRRGGILGKIQKFLSNIARRVGRLRSVGIGLKAVLFGVPLETGEEVEVSLSLKELYILQGSAGSLSSSELLPTAVSSYIKGHLQVPMIVGGKTQGDISSTLTRIISDARVSIVNQFLKELEETRFHKGYGKGVATGFMFHVPLALLLYQLPLLPEVVAGVIIILIVEALFLYRIQNLLYLYLPKWKRILTSLAPLILVLAALIFKVYIAQT